MSVLVCWPDAAAPKKRTRQSSRCESITTRRILKVAAKELEKDGYKLEIKEYSDYVQPNNALGSGDLDANYFQHITYLKNFAKEHKLDLVSVGMIHYEPFGIFPGKAKSLKDVKKGAVIAVPNDTTNEARALLLLEARA